MYVFLAPPAELEVANPNGEGLRLTPIKNKIFRQKAGDKPDGKYNNSNRPSLPSTYKNYRQQ